MSFQDPCRLIRAITKLLYRRVDPFPFFMAHISIAIDNPGHGDSSDAGEVCNVSHGGERTLCRDPFLFQPRPFRAGTIKNQAPSSATFPHPRLCSETTRGRTQSNSRVYSSSGSDVI